MELELKKERFEFYRPGAALVSSREETAETIVPDYCPDISRIVDVSACLLLRSQSESEGAILLSGSIKLTLLYLTEDTLNLRSLDYSIPFEHSEKLPEGCERASAEGRVCSAEARLLNPRKLLTRVDLEWKLMPYCKAEMTVCEDIPEQMQYSIETMQERHEVSLIQSVSSKDFVFSDLLTLPGGREPVGELLCTRVKPRVTEIKSIGSKAILKGVACVSLLYVSNDGKLCTYAEELAFSQILDGVAENEKSDISAAVVLNLADCECKTDSGDDEGRTVELKLLLNAFVVIRHTLTISCITDLYSTSYDLDAQMERIELWQEPAIRSVSQNVHEQLDTGAEVKCVLGTDVLFCNAAIQRENNTSVIHAVATLSVLYLDSMSMPFSIKRRVEITVETDVDEGAQAGIERVCAGDVSVNLNSSGIELRFPVECTLCSVSAPVRMCLLSLCVEKPDVNQAKDLPSLVLRTLEEGETLWDIAKQYRTTVGDILAANELTDSSVIEADRMLLIPRRR